MTKEFNLGGISIPYLYEGHFKKLFPKTSRYLEFILPLRHPSLFNPYKFELKDIPVYFVKDLSGTINKKHGLTGKNRITPFLASYIRGEFFIIIDLNNFFKSGLGSFNSFSKQTFSPHFIKKLVKYIDSLTKYRSLLVHEYEHFMQDKYSIKLDSRDSAVANSMASFTQLDCKSVAKKLIDDFETLSDDESLKYLSEYYMLPAEVEARLSQWIFMLIKGHSFESIRSFERNIFGRKSYYKDPGEIFSRVHSELTKQKTRIGELKKLIKITSKKEKYYRKNGDISVFLKLDKELDSLKSELKQLETSLPNLEFRSKRLHVATIYYDRMSKEAIRLAELFRKRYSHLSDVI